MSSVSYRHFTGTAAENYQRDFVPAIATPGFRDLLRAADLRPGERVLDVACGTGVILRLAAERAGGGTGRLTAPPHVRRVLANRVRRPTRHR